MTPNPHSNLFDPGQENSQMANSHGQAVKTKLISVPDLDENHSTPTLSTSPAPATPIFAAQPTNYSQRNSALKPPQDHMIAHLDEQLKEISTKQNESELSDTLSLDFGRDADSSLETDYVVVNHDVSKLSTVTEPTITNQTFNSLAQVATSSSEPYTEYLLSVLRDSERTPIINLTVNNHYHGTQPHTNSCLPALDPAMPCLRASQPCRGRVFTCSEPSLASAPVSRAPSVHRSSHDEPRVLNKKRGFLEKMVEPLARTLGFVPASESSPFRRNVEVIDGQGVHHAVAMQLDTNSDIDIMPYGLAKQVGLLSTLNTNMAHTVWSMSGHDVDIIGSAKIQWKHDGRLFTNWVCVADPSNDAITEFTLGKWSIKDCQLLKFHGSRFIKVRAPVKNVGLSPAMLEHLREKEDNERMKREALSRRQLKPSQLERRRSRE